jgi:hypothetical protein
MVVLDQALITKVINIEIITLIAEPAGRIDGEKMMANVSRLYTR